VASEAAVQLLVAAVQLLVAVVQLLVAVVHLAVGQKHSQEKVAWEEWATWVWAVAWEKEPWATE